MPPPPGPKCTGKLVLRSPSPNASQLPVQPPSPSTKSNEDSDNEKNNNDNNNTNNNNANNSSPPCSQLTRDPSTYITPPPSPKPSRKRARTHSKTPPPRSAPPSPFVLEPPSPPPQTDDDNSINNNSTNNSTPRKMPSAISAMRIFASAPTKASATFQAYFISIHDDENTLDLVPDDIYLSVIAPREPITDPNTLMKTPATVPLDHIKKTPNPYAGQNDPLDYTLDYKWNLPVDVNNYDYTNPLVFRMRTTWVSSDNNTPNHRLPKNQQETCEWALVWTEPSGGSGPAADANNTKQKSIVFLPLKRNPIEFSWINLQQKQ